MPTVSELRAFFERDFPQCTATLDDAAEGRARMRQVVGEQHLRPGGTVSGPTMMALADAAAYAAILATIGIVPLAVTTNLSMTFMRRPTPGRDLVAEAELLKVGARLVVADVRVMADGVPDVVAHATATYSVPPR